MSYDRQRRLIERIASSILLACRAQQAKLLAILRLVDPEDLLCILDMFAFRHQPHAFVIVRSCMIETSKSLPSRNLILKDYQ